jgi:hypothetical protein
MEKDGNMKTAAEMLELQQKLEAAFAKWNQLPFLMRDIQATSDAVEMVQKLPSLDRKFVWNFLVQMMLHKQMNIPTAVGMFRGYFEGDLQKTFFALLEIVKAGGARYENHKFITQWVINPISQERMDKFMYPLPMVIRPLKIKGNMDTGYLSHKESIVLRDNYTDQDVCIDVINKLNRIGIKLDMKTATTIKNQWRNLDHQKPDETIEDYAKRLKAFRKYNKCTLYIMNGLKDYELFITHAYDKRGRIYCRGYHVNYQGNSWNKAVINFSHGEKVTK